MSRIKAFCARKGVVCFFQHYGVDALGAMAQGLFCTLLVAPFSTPSASSCTSAF